MPKMSTIRKYQLPPINQVTGMAVSTGGGAGASADTVDGFHASAAATANTLCALNAAAKGPFDITGDAGTLDGLEGAALAEIAGAETITGLWTFDRDTDAPFAVTAGSAKVTNLDADLLDGLHASSFLGAQYLTLAADANLTAERLLTPGDGLDGADGGAGNAYTLSVDVTDLLGTGLSEDGSNNITLPTPGTLTVATSNGAAAPHTHAVTSSSSPGAAASLLATDASGYLTLVKLATDTLADKSGGNLTISPAGDVVFNPTGNDLLPASNYDLNIGSLDKKYLTLHAAELWVETLVAQNTLATIGGRILVGPTTTLESDLSDSATQMTVKHNEMAYGDTVYLEASGKVEFILVGGYAVVSFDALGDTVTIAGDHTDEFVEGVMFTITGATANNDEWEVLSSAPDKENTVISVTGDIAVGSGGRIVYLGAQGVGPYAYVSVTRNRDGSGANAWYAGDAVFNTGAAGDGWIDLYSTSGVAGVGTGPTIVGNVRGSDTYDDWDAMWAIGNLNGLYGVGADYYGVALGDYANGNYLLYDNHDGFSIVAGDGSVLIDDVGIWIFGTARRLRMSPTPSDDRKSGLYLYNSGAGKQTLTLFSEETETEPDYWTALDLNTANETDLLMLRTNWGNHLRVLPNGDMVLNGSSGDLQVGGGLYVGGVGTDPDTDDIWCDGEISTNGGTTRWDLGAYAATAPAATGYVSLTINGTAYKLLAAT